MSAKCPFCGDRGVKIGHRVMQSDRFDPESHIGPGEVAHFNVPGPTVILSPHLCECIKKRLEKIEEFISGPAQRHGHVHGQAHIPGALDCQCAICQREPS